MFLQQVAEFMGVSEFSIRRWAILGRCGFPASRRLKSKLWWDDLELKRWRLKYSASVARQKIRHSWHITGGIGDGNLSRPRPRHNWNT